MKIFSLHKTLLTGLHNRLIAGLRNGLLTALRNHKAICVIISLMLAASLLGGCAGRADSVPEEPGRLRLYYITTDIDGVMPVDSDIDLTQASDPGECLSEVASRLREAPDAVACLAPLSEANGYISYVIKDDQAIFDFDERLPALDRITSTLIRAAVTRSVTQINGLSSVSFTVLGQPLLDDNGMVVGALGADSYIDNAGLTINADERTQLTLYFTNETGDKLVKVSRMVVYSGNISMDKLVLNQLLLGPQDGENAYPVMNPETKVINVTTQDGTCYVNLDSSFLSPLYNISNDVAIYSIVNSLIELGSVNRVQFLIDSDSDALFRETVSLNTQFVRNLDIIEEQ